MVSPLFLVFCGVIVQEKTDKINEKTQKN